MATEKFILRPTGVSGFSSQIVPYPSNTPSENYHLLISEEIADDDASYLKNSSDGIAGISVLFEEPKGFEGIIPKKCRFILRCSIPDINSGITVYHAKETFDSEGLPKITNDLDTKVDYSLSAINTYENITYELSSDSIVSLWTAIEGIRLGRYTTNVYWMSFSSCDTGNTAKNEADISVNVTQIYVEVEYGDDDSEEVVPTSTTLRPVQVKDYTGTTINFNPTDTTMENAHTLINEEVSDEETEIGVTSGEKITIVYDYKKTNNICGMKHILSLKSFFGTLKTYIIEFNIFDISGQLISNETITVTGYESSMGYVDTIAISSDAFMALNAIEEGTIEVVFLSGTELATTHDTSIYAVFSQAYIELSFPTYEPIYIRENNSWTKLTGKVYQKQNGTWQECGTGILLEGSAKVIT